MLSSRSHITLALATLLHAFTHAYGTMLVPLYLLITADLSLGGVSRASLLVTLYGLAYCIFSLPAGVFADRVDRKWMLALNLFGNATVITAMGLTHSYSTLVLLSLLAGFFGAMFHPAASGLVTAHFPKSPGMAIGIVGIGAGLGFFAGPQFAGWRAEAAHWQMPWLHISDWQRPCVELGLIGVGVAVLFMLLAREVNHGSNGEPRTWKPPLSNRMRLRAASVALALSLRDFSGIATLSLASIYLQKARGLDAKQTGFILGAMTLISMVVNPLLVWKSAGRWRLPALAAVLVLGGVTLTSVPHWPVAWVLPVLAVFQAFHLGSYAVAEAGILERIPAPTRGRIVGLLITVAGTIASASPWAMGRWTDAMKSSAADPAAYALPFAVLGAMMALAVIAVPLIARLGEAAKEHPAVEPLTAISPQTVEAVG